MRSIEARHVVFQLDGTRYDLHLVEDVYGGTIVVWTTTGMMWRFYTNPYEIKALSKNCNKHDAANIFQFLEHINFGDL